GEKDYIKKHPTWYFKIPPKRTNCEASLSVKTYHDTPTVLGIYESAHNHPIGGQNLRYTRISGPTCDWIAGMVRMKVQSDHILDVLHGITTMLSDGPLHPSNMPCCNDFIKLADIHRIEKAIEAEFIRLDRDDGRSTFDWAQRLQTEDSLLAYKSVACPAPPNSGLAKDSFCLIIQTELQRRLFHEHGNNLLCIDVSHNTT
ncbi:hypothetical protein FPV67DRAFT_1364291, partial [Lyophyllum atratum]